MTDEILKKTTSILAGELSGVIENYSGMEDTEIHQENILRIYNRYKKSPAYATDPDYRAAIENIGKIAASPLASKKIIEQLEDIQAYERGTFQLIIAQGGGLIKEHAEGDKVPEGHDSRVFHHDLGKAPLGVITFDPKHTDTVETEINAVNDRREPDYQKHVKRFQQTIQTVSFETHELAWQIVGSSL